MENICEHGHMMDDYVRIFIHWNKTIQLFRLKIVINVIFYRIFVIPNLPKSVRAVPGVVAVDCGAELATLNCNCSRNDG